MAKPKISDLLTTPAQTVTNNEAAQDPAVTPESSPQSILIANNITALFYIWTK